MQTCETCRFVHVLFRAGDAYEYTSDYPPYEKVKTTRTGDAVQCRIRPPQMAQTEWQCDGWPAIDLADWCGEHQPKGTKHD